MIFGIIFHCDFILVEIVESYFLFYDERVIKLYHILVGVDVFDRWVCVFYRCVCVFDRCVCVFDRCVCVL